MTTFSALHTDRYELTMIDAAMNSGTHNRECAFEVFARHLPQGRQYGIVAGTGRLLELIENFHFTEADIRWLADNKIVHSRTLDWLANYRFSGTITGYHEGEVYFPNSPILIVDAPFAEAVILETLVLSVLNYDSAVASAASRMVSAAQGRPLAEMGSRRTNENSAVAAARAAFIAGFNATSNLEAGRMWGIPTMGTAAHAFTLLHDSEEAAFRAQVDTLGANTTLLIDTFDIPSGIEHALSVAGPQLGGIRLDSGDLPVLVSQVRAQLDAQGAEKTKITVTNELDEYSIGILGSSPVDAYGVGTAVVTGSGFPAANFVYKLVAHKNSVDEWVTVAKTSPGKKTRGGLKYAEREIDSEGFAVSENIYIRNSESQDNDNLHESIESPNNTAVNIERSPQHSARPLLVPLMTNGTVERRFLGLEGTHAARERRAMAVAELPVKAHRLKQEGPAIPTVYN